MRNVRIAVLCRCAGGSRSEPDRKISFSLVKTNPLSLATLGRQKTGKLRLNRSQSQRDPTAEPARSSIREVHWGGFFRRGCAFALDVVVILALSTIMFFMCYVGYKVGLSAHGRTLNWEHSTPLFTLFTWGWIGLATAYFVIFHGIEGKTIGKWLLGLRVVAAERSVVTYRRAFLRWIGMVGFAPVLLGFLWILWSREKRGWHDYLARTWVIRD